MKTLFATIAALALVVTGATQQASAYWGTRVVQRWDPACGRYVPVQERCWVPSHEEHHRPIYRHGEHDRHRR